MLKFAFIINMPGQNPDTYSGVYENSESYNLLVGVDGVEQSKDLVKRLVSQGYTLFNLCGDFDEEITTQLREIVGEGIKIANSDYLPEEAAKMEGLQTMSEYGIIIKMNGVESIEEVSLKCDDCNTTALFVKDQWQGEAAAKQLAEQGIDFIELCSWFDRERTEDIINAVNGKVPIGTCGEL